MEVAYILLSSALLMTSLVQCGPTGCVPGVNCRLPSCRCWDDPKKPGDFSDEWTPQMLAVTFYGVINETTRDKYLPLLQGLLNPNGCPVKGTFFVQEKDTSMAVVRKLSSLGHEIGITTEDGRLPDGLRNWEISFYRTLKMLTKAGLARKSVQGAMAPNFTIGGYPELQSEMQYGLKYEASCVLPTPKAGQKLMWPFTYDFPGSKPTCLFGQSTNKTFKGLWQFIVPEMTVHGHNCSLLSTCIPFLRTDADVFMLFYDSFVKHYHGGRAPMVLHVDLKWLDDPRLARGLMQFLGAVSQFHDTWMLTMSQALDWIKEPVPMYNSVRFRPWECNWTV